MKIWGRTAERRFFGSEHWRGPVKWNKEAKKLCKRRRVFCASMGDILEDRRDLDIWRNRLWNIIEETPWLDWLLLTKRPENFGKMVPWMGNWPSNVWIGATAENQEKANQRVPILLQYPALIRFVSCEPLLENVDLDQWLSHRSKRQSSIKIDWVIAGGESGYNARPTHPSWARNLRDQCVSGDVPFHFKQWGCWKPSENGVKLGTRTIHFEASDLEPIVFIWKGKKAAGRDLDGRIWDQIPKT